MPWCDTGRAQTLPVAGSAMPAVGMASLLLPNPVLASQQHSGDVGDDNHHLTPPFQQQFWALQPAQCSSYWCLQKEVNARELPQQIQAGHWDRATH